MALFRRKKKAEVVKSEEEKKDNSTLDLIKEAMAENEAQKHKETDSSDEIQKMSYNVDEVKDEGIAGLVRKYQNEKTQINLDAIITSLKQPDAMVYIPAQVVAGNNSVKGGPLRAPEMPFRINPLILTDQDGNKVFPIFSSENAIPDKALKTGKRINIPFSNCVSMMNNMKEIDTFVLDPYTVNIKIEITKNK